MQKWRLTMEKFKGKAIYGKIAIGKVFFFSKNQQQVVRSKIDDVEAEIQKYEECKRKAIEELGG